MNIELEIRPFAEVECDAMVVVAFEQETPQGAAADQPKNSMTAANSAERRWKSRSCIAPLDLKAKRLVLAGGGKRERFDSAELRKLAGAALRAFKAKGARNIALALDEPYRSDAFAAAAVEGALLADARDRTATRPIRKRTKSKWTGSPFWAVRNPRWITDASWPKRRTSRAVSPTNRPTC